MDPLKAFIKKVLQFCLIPLGIIVLGLLLPATPRMQHSMFFSKNLKDALLMNTQSPRIIFVGGSNLTFGLNSKMFSDSLGLNPINTAVDASIGLRFMLDQQKDKIRKGDAVVVVAEYSQFYKENDDCKPELVRSILDVSPKEIVHLKRAQWINFISQVPKYSFSKFRPQEYLKVIRGDIYTLDAFNAYGDVSAHWNLPNRKVVAYGARDSVGYNEKMMLALLEFEDVIKTKGAKMYVGYPCYQFTTYSRQKNYIKKIELEYKKMGFEVLGTPERYVLEDSLMFNTPYHPNKTGLDLRTARLIQDYRLVLNKH